MGRGGNETQMCVCVCVCVCVCECECVCACTCMSCLLKEERWAEEGMEHRDRLSHNKRERERERERASQTG